jgi:hypothetical protein
MEATQATGDLRRQALDFVVGQDLDGFSKAREALQGAVQGAHNLNYLFKFAIYI